MPPPTVRASTGPRAKKSEVFDKMTTVRGFGLGGNDLMDAMAAAIQAGSEGRTGLEKISERLQTQEKGQRARDLKRGKR